MINGQIISYDQKSKKNEVIKFDQLTLNFSDINTTQIKQPKMQETSTRELFGCTINNISDDKFCTDEAKKEIIPILNRRLSLPLYIPVISLLSSLLIIKSKKRYFSKSIVFFYCFFLLILIELSIKYTGLSSLVQTIFLLLPLVLILILYSFLNSAFSKEFKPL